MKILLVEDNQAIAKGLIYSLEQKDFEMKHTTTVKDTKWILSTENVDLIILDIRLPDGDGLKLYEEAGKAF